MFFAKFLITKEIKRNPLIIIIFGINIKIFIGFSFK